MRKLATTLFRFLASLKLAVTLIVVLAAVLAVATLIEADRGRDYARWYVYTQDWFCCLLGLLGVNILAAALIRFPWKWRQFGFVVTHAGLLVLLAGAIQTFTSGVDGQLALEEGQSNGQLLLRDANCVTVRWAAEPGKEQRPKSLFIFPPGPGDWDEGRQLTLGTVDGVTVKVLRYLASARPAEEWVDDEKGGVPALKFSLVGPDSVENREQWLTATSFGGSAAAGSARVEFRQAAADTMLDDFLHPPAKESLDAKGLLTVHYDGRVERVPVSANLGKKLTLPGSQIALEIAEYLPNARLQADGKYKSEGDKPAKPVLELRVSLPGEKEPLRQVVKPSFQNPGGMHVAKCPVKFWYHHPAVAAEPAVELMTTSDGKVYCRVGNGVYQPHGEVQAGDSLEPWPGSTLNIARYVPHARRELLFQPVKVAKRQQPKFEAAAQVEITAGGASHKLWLQRGEQSLMPLSVKTPEGTLGVTYGYDSLSLGFDLSLKKFTRGMNPGGMGDASFASEVHLQDDTRNVSKDQRISMNEPLVHGKYTFYQSGILPSGTGTLLTVAYDPGLLTKYLGCLMSCLGTVVMFVTRSKLAQAITIFKLRKTTKEQPMRRAIAASLLFLCLAGTATAAQDPGFDWKQWQSLPVQDGGRQKPLDSLAWETWRLTSNRITFTDPETKQSLDATAFYLSILLDSPTWEKKTEAAKPGTCTGTAAGGDKWDAMPLLLVDSSELHKALGVAPGEKCISPAALQSAKMEAPKTQKPTTFMLWAQQLVFRDENELSPFEKKGVELFNRLRAYQEHRAGRKLGILPMPNSEEKPWISLEGLMRSKLNDESDPSGTLRELQATFGAVRTAYLARSAADFNAASHKFIAMVRELGPQLGAYPKQKTIDMEVAYNHWAPFRFAWALTLAGGLGVLIHMGSRWRSLYPIGIAAYVAGIAAVVVGFAMRVQISGRAPVTNMYESVVYVGLGTAAIGLILELVYRRRYILVAAASVATVALILADNAPAILDPSLHPLQPVLRNNFWLVVHVMTITLSYAALALALGIANITLGYFLVKSENRPAILALSQFTYRAVQVGVVLLFAGTVLGGVWAAYSWGRFWGWDPKEVWALIALLGYLAVLHARFAGWVGHRGMAALAVGCFALVVVAWYGVNFVLGAGLHSYGFGGGGKGVVGTFLALQSAYVAAALWRSRATAAAQGGVPRLRLADLPDDEETAEAA